MKHLSFLLLILSFCVKVNAQKTYVITSMETKLPLKGAIVMPLRGAKAITDYTGKFYIKGSVDSVTIYCVGYLTLKTRLTNHNDTISLLPSVTQLQTVEVIGQANWATERAKEFTKDAKNYYRTPFIGFDFFKMFDNSRRKPSKKELEKRDKILKEY